MIFFNNEYHDVIKKKSNNEYPRGSILYFSCNIYKVKDFIRNIHNFTFMKSSNTMGGFTGVKLAESLKYKLSDYIFQLTYLISRNNIKLNTTLDQSYYYSKYEKIQNNTKNYLFAYINHQNVSKTKKKQYTQTQNAANR